MNDITTKFILLAVLILCSAFFSATETAFSSLNKIRLKNLANDGNKKAEKTLKLAENYSDLISTVLIGNNIVNIASASLATIIFIELVGQDDGPIVSTAVMTIIVLIFGEITPKNIAKEMPEAYAMFASPVIGFLNIILFPFNFLFGKWKELITKMFKLSKDEGVTSDELVTIIEEAEAEGGLEEHESDLIVAAIEFNDLEVKEILTHRVDVISINITSEIEDIRKMFNEYGFSRIPVYENSIDNIIGIILERDFYHLYYNNENVNIRDIIKEVVFTNPKIKVASLLKLLQASKSHMAIVLDEYGGTEGIITMEDILEELVGEIYDEHDEVEEEDFTYIDDNSSYVEGDTDLEDLFERFNIKNKDDHDFVSVSGWIIHMLDKMPEENDCFEYKNLQITVTKCDGKKVEQAKVEVLNQNQ